MKTNKLTIKRFLKTSMLSAIFVFGSITAFGQTEDEMKKPSNYDKKDNVFNEKRDVDAKADMSSAKAPARKMAVDNMEEANYNQNYWSNKYENRKGATKTSAMSSTMSQQQTNQKLEKTQKEKEKKLEEIYGIVMDYPEFSYEYKFGPNGELQEVEILGVEDASAEEELAVLLVDLYDFNKQLMNQPAIGQTYYLTEDEAEPKQGYNDFYNELYSNLSYPEEAEERGVEGTMYVKFIVTSEGEVDKLQVAHDIETPYPNALEAMKESAKKAVEATSGDWEPATVAGQKVSEYVVIPVSFDFEVNPSLKAPIR